MEMELNNIIEKIKKDGIQHAEREAKDIVSRAEHKAGDIITGAEKKKADIIDEAEARAREFKDNAEKAVSQAARDVLLTLRERIADFFSRITKERVGASFSEGLLKEVISEAVRNFRKEGAFDIEVLVSDQDKAKLEKSLLNELSKEVKGHFVLTGSKSIEKGFRIGEKGKDSYFDFTDDAIAEAFKKYLSPKLLDVLDIDLGLEKS